jgi:hypothetical protein
LGEKEDEVDMTKKFRLVGGKKYQGLALIYNSTVIYFVKY